MDDNKRHSSTDAQAGPGPTLYIINLCASLAPVPTTGNTLPGLENYRLYQVARVEDGRTRHRLRLGFFTSESHANSVLAVVRQKYPTAFTASLSAEDHRFTRGHLPAAAAQAEAAPAAAAAAPAKAKPAAASARNGTAATGQGSGTPAPARNGTAPSPKQPAAATASPPRQSSGTAPADVIEVTWEPDDADRAEASSARLQALTQEDYLDELTWEGPALDELSAAAAAAAVSAPVPPAAVTPAATAAPAAPPSGQAPAKPSAIPVLTLTDTASMPIPMLTPGDAPAFKPRAAAPAASPAPAAVRPAAAAASPNGRQAPAPARQAAAPQPNKVNGKPVTKPTPAMPAPAGQLPPKARPQAAPRPAPAGPLALQDEFSAPTLEPALTGPAGLDSTQTLRALTDEELQGEVPEKWFAIQLAASEQPANLDTMPHLDIFEAYRLYSVAMAAEGKITHSLRLGFFKEDVSAEAVSGYLKTFFPNPTVLRVSLAEQLRFKDAPQPRRPSAEEARSNVIELNDARAGRGPAPVNLSLAAEPPAPAAAAAAPVAATASRPAPVSSAPASMPQPRNMPRNGTPVVKRPQATRTKPSSKYRSKKSLTDALMDEARDLELGESGSRKPPPNNSLLSRLVGKLTK